MRISENQPWFKGILFVIFIFAALSNAVYACVGCEDKPQPIYASAVVDGNSSEWIHADDFFAPMHRAGKTSKDVLSNAYLRYDCSASILYVLIEKATSFKILAQDGDEVFVKINGSKKVSSDNDGDSGSCTFSWINKIGSYADGWEASFSLGDGLYDILIHNNVWDGEEQTSSTDKSGLELCIECPGIDYGDAPNDGGLFLYGSASHKIVSGMTVFMGDAVDDDPTYVGDIGAGTDDNSDGTDDEDGVTFYIQNYDGTWSRIDGSEFFKGRTYKVAVDIQLDCHAAKLAAWFDFFIDGQFGNEIEETIIDNKVLENTTSGTASIRHEQIFQVPAGASKGTTYLRFRLDCQSENLTPTGLAHVAGEVEDYVTNIDSEPPVAVTLTSFTAARSNEGVLVEWSVASEVGHAGYNIYSSTTQNGPWNKLNDILILTPEFSAQSSSQHYDYLDDKSSQNKIFYSLEAVNVDGTSDYYGPVQSATASAVLSQVIPNKFELEQNYPNPFNPSTTIKYALPEPTAVTITIYDVKGRAVKTLYDAVQTAGRHTLVWDATNEYGESVPSGLYLYRMQTAQFTKMSRMTLLK
jgi:hypothetical protein